MAGTTKQRVTSLTKKPKDVVERNALLLGGVMRYLLAQPQLLHSLPDQFELVILPEDDPAMRLYNLELLDRYGSEGKPVVFVRIKSGRETDGQDAGPSLYVPLAR
ncbi:MAG: DUF5647 family protein [Candidatus Binatia bacterium]